MGVGVCEENGRGKKGKISKQHYRYFIDTCIVLSFQEWANYRVKDHMFSRGPRAPPSTSITLTSLLVVLFKWFLFKTPTGIPSVVGSTSWPNKQTKTIFWSPWSLGGRPTRPSKTQVHARNICFVYGRRSFLLPFITVDSLHFSFYCVSIISYFSFISARIVVEDKPVLCCYNLDGFLCNDLFSYIFSSAALKPVTLDLVSDSLALIVWVGKMD